ncbi:hypothetical protein Vafri_10619 [Volvox africanus]|uniref:Uncharacterized protein n=1 Tax=Volvox africanus TaxID=51714 RepID=A0A8J4EZS1_9CHLO|nr:hypothetical protein Vafri_10619 [Volvox africanus]
MSDSEEEWITVRRRRGGRSVVSKQLKKLAIPVVPLAFDALAEPEETPAPDASTAKTKKKNKKSKAVDDADDDAGAKPAGASDASKAGGKQPGTGKKAVQLSFFAWLWSRLAAVLVLLGLMKAVGAGKKKKRKSKAAAPKVAEESPRVAATVVAKQASAEAQVPDKDKDKDKDKPRAAAAAAPARAAANSQKDQQLQQKQQQQQQQQKESVLWAMPPSIAANPVVTPKKQPEAPKGTAAPAATVPAVVATSAKAPAETALAAATGVATSTATPPPVKSQPATTDKPKAVVREPPVPVPPAAPTTPVAPPAPMIKYDADWNRGKFVMQALATGHADVVAAVALAGDVAVSAGYDGAVKLWHWPAPGTAGGGVVPRLAAPRALVGHTGRVEALAAHADSRRLATSGRDSMLKVWDLGSEPGGSGARELCSTYVYESVRSLAADWAGEGAVSAGRVLLGARSGTVLLYSLGSGGGGRKMAVLRGHQDEVTALKFLYGSDGGSGQVAVSGSRDGTVRLWDLRAAGAAATAVLTGLSGRVCSLAALGEHQLLTGDCSSTVKMWDLRQLPSSSASQSAAAAPPPPRRLPNAPGFAGDSCPTAGLWHGPRSNVLLSSCIAWWTSNKEALEEAPASTKLPMACLNVSAVGVPAGANSSPSDASSLQCQYQYTLRLGPGVVTCLTGSADEGAVLAGGASGTLWALRLVRGGSAAAAAAERAVAAATEAAAVSSDSGYEVVDALVVGAEEFSDDEYDDGEEEAEEDEESRR